MSVSSLGFALQVLDAAEPGPPPPRHEVHRVRLGVRAGHAGARHHPPPDQRLAGHRRRGAAVP